MELDNFTITVTNSNITTKTRSIMDAFRPENMRHGVGWTVTFIIAYSLTLILGLIGNFLVLKFLSKDRRRRTVTNTFIINLTAADLCVITVCVIPTLLANILKTWELGLIMCKGVAYIQGVSVCASAYSLAALSIHRYLGLYWPGNGLSQLQANVAIFLIWTFSGVILLPWLFTFTTTDDKDDGNKTKCIEVWDNESHGKLFFGIVNLVCGFIIPLVLTGFSNIRILCNVARRELPSDLAFSVNIKNMHRRTRQSVTNMLVTVTCTFVVCWLPLYVLVSVIKFSSGEFEETGQYVISILFPITQWLGISNSSMNPVLYSFINSKFLESFKSKIPKCLRCKRKPKPEPRIPLAINARVGVSSHQMKCGDRKINIKEEKLATSETQFHQKGKKKPVWIRRVLLIKGFNSEYALATKAKIKSSSSCEFF